MIFSTWRGMEGPEMESHEVTGPDWTGFHVGIGPPTVWVTH
jgi:hypothetical protein